jgi:hypothetical protein
MFLALTPRCWSPASFIFIDPPSLYYIALADLDTFITYLTADILHHTTLVTTRPMRIQVYL